MQRLIKFFILYLISFQILCCGLKNVDLVLFSFDRPLQVYAFLESLEKYCVGLGEVHVIYRASSQSFLEGYDIVRDRFQFAFFHQQGPDCYTNFKPLVMQYAFETPSAYVLFAVDDIVVKRNINLRACVESMEKNQAYGFYLRLGFNITECYMQKGAKTSLPYLHDCGNDIYKFSFNQSSGDWGYPNTLDMAIYRKADIERDIKKIIFKAPNTFEGAWANLANLKNIGLCFSESKIVNVPINLVNEEYIDNRNMGLYSKKELLNIFDQGLKIDIDHISSLHNSAPHMPCYLKFVARG